MQTALTFLNQLKDNNTREWFQEHKDEYEQSRSVFIQLVKEILTAMAPFEPELSELDAKSCVFRIYRDVRFSKDKSPYKTHYGAWIANANKSLVWPGYYIHIQPGESFLAGGLWMPPADQLKKIRQEIDYNGHKLHEIIDNATFQKFFKDFSEEEKLKTSPKGYPSDHPDIEWLKLKSFTVSCRITDAELNKKTFKDSCVEVFQAIKPLNDFLKTAIV
ncbi:DUF2461 domain-containing protein [Cytophagaceae bacterium YF14B1]|uniref:DUF2461 domain-containing protein n=1 Tax=Xanthocytophaga flava TaxID=3048013 RepID=A0AAE3QSS3_9BACT|nr:DUF2461 domain-containing protein [Xanthocytophaga flavus]MDJ1482018.1 DUF2461 domain-containing protein [Xanthocytophaga flavus]